MTERIRAEVIKKSKIGSELTDEQCAVLSELVEVADYADGDVVVPEGAKDDKLRIVLSGALAVAKKFIKGVLNRDPRMAMLSLTQDFQSRFKSQEELESFLKGPTDPYYSAYELQTLTQKDPKEMEVKLTLVSVSKGKRGSKRQGARLLVREGKTDWNVDEFELVR